MLIKFPLWFRAQGEYRHFALLEVGRAVMVGPVDKARLMPSHSCTYTKLKVSK